MSAVKSYKPCPRCAENFTARGKLCDRCVQRDRDAAKRVRRIPISAAQYVAKRHGLKQVVLIGFDGEAVHIVTYGATKRDCELAAQAQAFWVGHIREFSFTEMVQPDAET